MGFLRSRKLGNHTAGILKILPDLLALFGLSMLGYGLFLLEPWLAFTACGAIMLCGGVFLATPERRKEQ